MNPEWIDYKVDLFQSAVAFLVVIQIIATVSRMVFLTKIADEIEKLREALKEPKR